MYCGSLVTYAYVLILMAVSKKILEFVILLAKAVQLLIKILSISVNCVLIPVIYLGVGVVNYLFESKRANIVEMKRKNKIPNSSVTKQQKIEQPNVQNSDKSEVWSSKPTRFFANFSYKSPSGANNWMKFVESSQQTKSDQKFANLSNKNQTKPINENINLECNNKTKGYKDKKILDKINHKISLDLDTKPKSEANISHKVLKEPSLTKQIAIDCEMVGVEIGVDKNMLARISLVNANGDCIYDKYVKPTEPVLDYRTRVSGIRPKDLENATDFKIVQKEVADIIRGRILVGHALKNDLKVLYLSHPKHAIRDTSKFKKFREGRTPALRNLVKKYLGATIQDGEHNSIQDALATMQLYKMFKKEWEASIRKHNISNYKDNNTGEVKNIKF